MFKLAEEQPHLMHFALNARHREFLPDLPAACSSTPFMRMHIIVEEGMRNREIRAIDSWVAAASLFGGATRLVQLKLDGVIQESLFDHLDECWQIACMSVENRE